MKKSIALLALAFGVTGAYAQDLTSKKGEPFLPEAEDMAVSIDATPFLNYVGNFFGKTGPNAAPTWNFLTTNQTITIKKFKDAQNAYRASVRIGFQNNGDKRQIADATVTTAPSYPTVPTMKEDKRSTSSTNVGLSVGMEKRRGKTRLQGVYGAEVGLGINTSSEKYTYGNALTAATAAVPVTVANSTNFGTNITTDTYGNAARVTKRKNGLGFDFGVRAFVGAEYFVAPKVSIGGEFGWGLGFSMNGASKTTVESVDVAGAGAVGSQETKGNKSSSFVLDTDNNNSFFGPSAALRLNLHF